MTRHGRWSSRALLALALAAGSCAEEAASEDAPIESVTVAEGTPISKTSASGPVKATVTVTPEKARLGDTLSLTLTVEADAGIHVEMPQFGEVLGRFTIVRFTPRRTPRPGGGVVHEQVYLLQAPMSGRKRIPPLRIEFTDRRGATSGKPGASKTRELLTEELSVQIESVLPAGSVAAELRPPLEPLALGHARTWLHRAWPFLLGGLALLAIAIAVPLLRRRSRRIRRVSAYELAMAQLLTLESGGYPGPDEVDAWYVTLSDAVRHYLENRFDIHAPEQTTEEFLRVAGQSDELSEAHRQQLGEFLAGCDRVKFAGYRPGEGESRAALSLARAFISDTRIIEDDGEAAA